ncbi:MAG: SiaB family protein kinase [Bacteroidales bacterium]|jgi:hypothetical protein|nr:SiaB family protein kinase [Bacteroidales bacterium]
MSFNVESYFSEVTDGKPVVYFKGNVDSDLINSILDTVEGQMISGKENPRLRKKVYNVLVESLQNLYHHAEKVAEGFEDKSSGRFGIVDIRRSSEGYRIITGNFIRSVNVNELEERIKKINQSNHEEITELYKFILNHQRISSKGGGGLGLVDIARKTGNRLEYSFREYDKESSFFYLDILVSETK